MILPESDAYLRAFLSIFDLTIIYEVYKAYKDDEDEATDLMLATQIGEQQILLQSVFVIRTWRDNNIATTISLIVRTISQCQSNNMSVNRVGETCRHYRVTGTLWSLWTV